MPEAAPIVMPKLGLTMTEGLLASWRVGPGDRVRPGDVLFVVETEKIATEIEATGEGQIQTIEAREGATVPVGTVVATWTGAGPIGGETAVPAPDAPPPSVQDAAERTSAVPLPSRRVIATPLARRLALQRGINLSGVSWSGPYERIRERDVVADARGGPRADGPSHSWDTPDVPQAH